ncbi:MAG: hypothetical protein LBV54_02265 [Puniceicoccales bacterium]|jgi:hypothetical protein|nr:hypothetical protein [Puniceicoccales bacterium]
MSEGLSPEQKNSITQWVLDGATLSEIQKRINAEFGVPMTYMDVRFLVDDLDLTLKDKASSAPIDVNGNADQTTPDATDGQVGSAPDTSPDGEDDAGIPPASGKVTVTINPVQTPDGYTSGEVTFSDGQIGQWQLDGYGRLGFIPPYEGYQPAPADIPQFQTALKNELAKLGY